VSNKEEIGSDWIDKSIFFIQKNRMQVFYNLTFILIIFIMIPGFISVLDGTVVEVDLPPKGKIIVTNQNGNKLYYELWTEHYTNNKEYIEKIIDGEKIPVEFTFSILDFDYSNIEHKYGEYLKRYKPSKLIKESHLFKKFIKNVKVKMISQKFVVENINTSLLENGHRAKSIVKGVAYQQIAGVTVDPKECSYIFGFERLGGKIYGTSLQTDCF
jgi:hypothetical protein